MNDSNNNFPSFILNAIDKKNMSEFNISTRKEDISLRLRVQNLKHANETTKRLEDDNRKMEERLNELKTAMTIEKEERERQGQGFWGRGQSKTGSLNNYASEVLQKKTEKSQKDGKKKKVKVLQDEPLDIPKRPSKPGTMKFIAQRKIPTGSTPRDKNARPKCGQCEDRIATLSCMQCSEIYCPGCFAAFHLKGALKQHRSVPLSAVAGPRICMSPNPSSGSQSPRASQASGAVLSQIVTNENGSGAAGPVRVLQSSPRITTDLLTGDYDESQSAASFQAALMAWRTGEESDDHQVSPVGGSPRKPVIASPINCPVVAVDSFTSTVDEDEKKPVEIKFTNTLSYAERLMLKGHRRTELTEMQTPRLDDDRQSYMSVSSQSGRPSSSSSFLSSQQGQSGNESYEDSISGSDDERVNFNALFEAITSNESPDVNVLSSSSQSSVSVVEIQSQITRPSDPPGLKQSGTYIVEEVTPVEAWNTENNIKIESVSSPTFIIEKHTKTSKRKSLPSSRINTVTEIHTQVNSEYQNHQSIHQISKRHQNSLLSESTKVLSKNSSENENSNTESTAVTQEIKRRPSSSSKRPSSARKQSLSKTVSRPQSRAGSRAQSGSISSMSQVEGSLTKTPSDALTKIASMLPATEYSYQSPMEGFFLVGVKEEKPTLVQDRVITPSNSRKQTEKSNSTSRPGSRAGARSSRLEKATVKVSNKLYQMAPRSWRPDSSLGEAVPIDQVKINSPDQDLTLSYSYSGQLSGQALDIYPSSRLGAVQTTEDAERTDGVFGDELFTERSFITPTPRTKSALKTILNEREYTDSGMFLKDKSSHSSYQSTFSLKNNKTKNISDPIVQNAPISSHDSRLGSATPVRDRLRRKAESRRSMMESGDWQSSAAPTPSGLQLLPSKPGPNHFRRETTEDKTISQSENIHTKNISGKSSLKEEYTSQRVNLSRQGTKDSLRGVKSAVSRQPLDVSHSRRPLSSKQLPKSARSNSSQNQDIRPNSSTDSTSQRRTTSQSYGNDDNQSDTVVADLLISRMQADNWMSTDGGIDQPMSNSQNRRSRITDSSSINYTTEVRPFSGLGLASASGDFSGGKQKQNRPSSVMSTASGRESRAIVMEGEDLSCYDDVGVKDEQNSEDKQSLDQLEWELAKDTGRVTADGQISRQGMHNFIEDVAVHTRSGKRSQKHSMNLERDISNIIREDEKLAAKDMEEREGRQSRMMDQDDVRALQ